MRPIDVATKDTLRWVLEQLPVKQARLLEVGCGNGEVALRLQRVGYQVIAIDASEAAVQQARSNGVEASLAEWPDFEADPFDAILFTRSLHHIHNLNVAVERAAHLLRPSGRIILEEFAFDAVTSAEAEWVYSVLSLLKAAGQLRLAEDSFAKELLDGGGSFALWQHDHDHDLHSAAAMQTAVVKHFDVLHTASVPYLYRYLLPALPDNDQGYQIARQLLALEQRLTEMSGIQPIGRRWVGLKR